MPTPLKSTPFMWPGELVAGLSHIPCKNWYTYAIFRYGGNFYDVTQGEKWKFQRLVMKTLVTGWTYILRPRNSYVDFHCYPNSLFDHCFFPYRLHLASNGCKIHLLGFHQWIYCDYYQSTRSPTELCTVLENTSAGISSVNTLKHLVRIVVKEDQLEMYCVDKDMEKKNNQTHFTRKDFFFFFFLDRSASSGDIWLKCVCLAHFPSTLPWKTFPLSHAHLFYQHRVRSKQFCSKFSLGRRDSG